MSRHEVVSENRKWVFGWDNPLMNYFLQVHDATLPEEENPIFWKNDMYDLEELVGEAKKQGLDLSPGLQKWLFNEKDEGL